MTTLRLLCGFATAMSALAITSLPLAAPVSALPGPGVPNLLGKWTVVGKGAVLCKVEASRCKTHHHGDFSNLEAVADITRQQGRILQGVYKSKYATEKFLATVGYDNKSFFLVDEDGFADGRIIDGNQIQVVYRHTTDLDSVIDLSSWTRR
jgi:hypothetical protein